MEEFNKSDKSKKIVSILLSVLILLILIGGTSYAAWRYNFVGTLTNIISTPDIEIDLLESDDEIISLTNTLPMTDEEGLSQNEEFQFAVTSKTTKEMLIGYTVSIEKLQPDTGYTFLNDQDIKIYLEDFNGNVVLEPTKVSELNNYKLYVGAHSHNSQNELLQDKFKLKVWIDESKTEDAKSWDMNTKLQYKFKLGITANETNALTVNAVVNNGTITGNTSVQVVEGGNAKFSMTPTDSTSEGIVSCTNNQTGTIKNNTLTVSNVTESTTCTVTYTPSTTTLFTDGTLIINEKPSQRQSNITEHGEVTNEYQALSNSNSYVFSGSSSQPWNSKKTSIKSVEIGQRIKPTSTAYWFYNLTNMEKGDFTNLDTKNVTNMSNMFLKAGYNSSATSFTITGLNNWDTSKVANMSSVFEKVGYQATNWSIGDLANWDTSSVTNMSYMFSSAGLKGTTWSIGDLSNWDTSSVTNMSYMFERVGGSATAFELNLSNWDTSKVTNMSYMFSGAGFSATTFDIGNLSNWDTSKVTNMSNMFSSAGYIATTFDIGNLSNWDTSSVTNMNSMYREAFNSATTFDIGNLSSWDTSKVTDMRLMFFSAGYNATTWSIGNLSSWDTSSVTNMESMFYRAGYSATTFDIGNLSSWDTSKVTDMSSMFSFTGYHQATTWDIGVLSNWNTSSVTNMSNMFSFAGNKATTFDIGNLSNWDTSKVTDMNSMFRSAGYSATTWSIGDLSSWDTSKVTFMHRMFEEAGYSATTWNSIGTLKVYATNIDYMFSDCRKAKATLNVYSNPNYSMTFANAARYSNALITVNYSSATANIDNIIATKSNDSNVVKGVQLD